MNDSKHKDLTNDKLFTLGDLILVLSKNAKIIIYSVISFFTFSLLYIMILDPIYSSTSKIMSSGGTSNLSNMAGLASQFGFEIPTNSNQSWVYEDVIKSKTVARRMLDLKYDTYEFGGQKSLLQILTYGNDSPEYEKDTLEIIAIDNFINMIDISRDRETEIYTISINASEPTLAKDLNESLIQQIEEHQHSYNLLQTNKTRKFIESRIIETKGELVIAEEDLKNFRDRNRRIENSPALLLEQQRLQREVIVLTEVYTTLKQQLETTKIEEVKDADYVIVLDQPEIPLFKSNASPFIIIIVFLIIGFISGVSITFLKAYKDSVDSVEVSKFKDAKKIIIEAFSKN